MALRGQGSTSGAELWRQKVGAPAEAGVHLEKVRPTEWMVCRPTGVCAPCLLALMPQKQRWAPAFAGVRVCER